MTRLQSLQRELTRHAARMLGSRFEAEDAVQEAMMRAWNARDQFEGRSQLRSWLYRICTNVCLDMLASRQRQGRPGLHAFENARMTSAEESIWAPSEADPADLVLARESVRLALVTVQQLPRKQRAVLILREVLHWSSAEIAEFLDTSESSVNSALQRARATLRGGRLAVNSTSDVDMDEGTRARLGRYAQALATSDVNALTALLAQDAA